VFRACRFPSLVRNARPLLAASGRVLGAPLTSELVRATFFSQFVGGESEAELVPLVAALSAEGVGSILDYAAEADVGEAGGGAAAHAAADAHAAHCLRMSLSAVASAAAAGGFAAVKVTGLVEPELLQAVTLRMHEHRRAFRALAGLAPPAAHEANPGEEREEGPYLTRSLTLAGFEAAMRSRRGPGAPGAAALDALPRVFALLDARRTGVVDYLDWCDGARLLGFGAPAARAAAAVAAGFAPPGSGAAEAGAGADALLALLMGADCGPKGGGRGCGGALAPAERERWAAACARAATLCAAARAAGVSLMFDAEQTYLQGAIDLVVVTMQRRFNGGADPSAPLPEEAHAAALAAAATGGAPAPAPALPQGRPPPPLLPAGAPIAVFNTYQAYLRDAPSRLALAVARARREGWAVGVKLVRGAYMRQERERAGALRYNDPIHRTIEGTHAGYAVCAQQLLAVAAAGEGAFMLATHNTASCTAVAAALAARRRGGAPLPGAAVEAARRPGGVSFGQLLGMSDGLTFALAAEGHAAFKYVPYGPVAAVTPYLLRRGEENADLVTSNVSQEIEVLQKELGRRLLPPWLWTDGKAQLR
jgi:proline dehydrogenase